jgi:tetratricopeptide (TPR) repeat protein
MRRTLLYALLALLSSAPLANAQDQTNGLAHLFDLNRHGQLPQLIQSANALLSNEKLPPLDRSVVLTYLGHAYQLAGDFPTAIGYYDRALAILDRDSSHPVEYATTLGAMAALYSEFGQPGTAKHMLLRSLKLFEKGGDHAEIAWIWNNLATIAANKPSIREAHKCMEHAIAESQLATNLSSDESAALLTTQARIAEIEGDPRTAIADYRHALALSKQSHNDQHPETAWLYVLLGGAYLHSGDLASAREMTSLGMNLLEAGSGRQSPRYISAQLIYSDVLDASGSHNEASTLRQQAQATQNTTTNRQRAQSQISVNALR